MSTRSIDFVIGSSPGRRKKKSEGYSLCRVNCTKDNDLDVTSVIRTNHANPQTLRNDDVATNDGLRFSPNGPLTSNVVKPYQLAHLRTVVVESAPTKRNTLLEIAVREVKIHPSFNGSQAPVEISSVSVLFGDQVVCKASSPFNRRLHKFLIDDCADSKNLSINVQSRCDASSVLPLPLPERSCRDSVACIDFSIRDASGRIHSGTVLCTISLTTDDCDLKNELSARFAEPSEDPGDSQACSSLRPSLRDASTAPYFNLYDPALCLNVPFADTHPRRKKTDAKLPEIVVSEQPISSIVSLSCGKWFQARRPLRPTSGNNSHKHRTGREELVTITVLRGVEVPVREESALVQPLIEINWGSLSRSTSAADGPAPIWQQTIELELPRRSNERMIKFSLYDRHPIWGLQWLGDASIPLEFHRNYHEVERWIGLSPISSPVLRFGYVQASPVRSYTKIYVLMKIESLGNGGESSEITSVDGLAKSIQRCMTTPYRIPGLETPEDCAELAMLLGSLPSHYGPLAPRQALKLNKVDDYGRAALLASLLQGLGLDAYVLLGYSQSRKYAGFVVSFDDHGTSPCLWDPENGEHYDFEDSRCSLIKTSRMINHQNIWKNIQKATTVPFNLRFNPKSNKDWQPLPNSAVGTATADREVQTLDVGDAIPDADDAHLEIERHLREKLSQWRSDLALTTIFNRHAVTIIRGYLAKFNGRADSHPDKKELRQLHRAYHTHGFVLNLRNVGNDELADRLFSTKIHAISGPVEFAVVCRVQRHIAKTCSIWLAVVVLRDRD